MRGRAILAPMLLALWPLAATADCSAPPSTPQAGHAATAEADQLYDLMQLSHLVETMRIEGLRMTEDMAADYLSPGMIPAFRDMVRGIYQADRMDRVMRRAFVQRLCDADPWQLDHLLAFYGGPAAQQIVRAELAARQDFLKDGVEQAAGRAAEMAQVEDPALYDAVGAYVETGDLVELNLGWLLNANYSFYRGLVAGGAFSMTEEEMLADVWQQEEGARLAIELWLRAFLTHAYRDLPPEALTDYLTVMESPEGQRLLAALFEAYGVLYNQLYRALGVSVSTLLAGEDL